MGCGICGFVGLNDSDLLKKMIATLRHRGPDETGSYVDNNVALGISRLSIIDLVSGTQPIHNEDSTIWTVYNGEIYNYVELKEELEGLGHSFYTTSDTEVIVHGYEEWGENCVTRFRGMFALVVWDVHKRTLFIARDRFGKKPLYYASLPGIFLFGSEIKALLAYELLPRQIDYEALDLFFAYHYIPSPYSIFNHVKKLPPGHYLKLQNGEFSIRKYWDISFNQAVLTDEKALADLLYTTLSEAVRLRLRSDVPLGAFLSGGIDSSTVVALMSKLGPKPPMTISIGFKEQSYNELKHAARIADYLGTDHTEYVVEPSASELLPQLVWHFDEPFADVSMIPTYYVSKVARNKVKVALSGDGGDEMFMGYPWLVDPVGYGSYKRFPRVIRNAATGLLLKMPMDSMMQRRIEHISKWGYGDADPESRYTIRLHRLLPGDLARLYSPGVRRETQLSETTKYLFDWFRQAPPQDYLSRADYVTMKTYLSENILVKVDRMSMAVSIEVRCPMLDSEVAELIGRIPPNLKMKGKVTKYIMKKMLLERKILPKENILRGKMGFGVPLEYWFKGEWGGIVEDLLADSALHRYIDQSYVAKLLSKKKANAYRLYAVMIFAIWRRIYLEEGNLTPNPKVAV